MSQAMTPIPVHGIAHILFADTIKHLDKDVKDELLEISKAYRGDEDGNVYFLLDDFLAYVESYIEDKEGVTEEIMQLQNKMDDWVHDMQNEEIVAIRASHIKFNT